MQIGTVSRTPILQEILRTQNPLLEKHCAFSEAIRLCQVSWMCKKQSSVSHSSTESEIISLDASLKMDGISALDLWDLIVTVLHRDTNQSEQEQGDLSRSLTRKKIPGKIDDLNSVDFVSSNANSSREEAMLCIFEDNEARHKGKKPYNETCFQNLQSCS